MFWAYFVLCWLLSGLIGRIVTRKLDILFFSLQVYESGFMEQQRKREELGEDVMAIIVGPFYLLLIVINATLKRIGCY